MGRKVAVALLGTVVVVWGVAAVAQGPEAIAKGQEVYTAQKCAMCHSIAGKGNPKGVLDDVGNKLKADEIREWLINPKEMAVKMKAERKPPMKMFDKLPKEDMDALVAYLLSLKK